LIKLIFTPSLESAQSHCWCRDTDKHVTFVMVPQSTTTGTANVLPDVTDVFISRPHEFLQPSKDLHSSILALSKVYLDPVASTVSAKQLERLQFERKNRKRKRKDDTVEEQILRLKGLTIEGFNAQQVWEQAKRIAVAVGAEVQRISEEQAKDVSVSDSESDQDMEEVHDNELGVEMESDDAEEMDGFEDEFEDDDDEEGDDEDIEDDSGDGDDEPNTSTKMNQRAARLVEDKFGLNDGFFSIDDFNRRTELLEQQDFRGDPDPEAASDEEDIDYEIDPMSLQPLDESKKRAKGQKFSEEEDDDDEDDDEEDGPTFGDMDLDAPEGASDEEVDDTEVEDKDMDRKSSKALMYTDFFDAPAQKQARQKSGKAQKSSFEPKQSLNENDFEADIQKAMSAVHKDIFSDESEEEEAEEPQNSQPGKLSTHEQRKATILNQIRELEATLIAKRPWVLAGEAKASDRPRNALLEEVLDFERTGKPLPVVTKETSEEIEELIKRRILAGEFDEVRKRRPEEALGSSSFARRGKLFDQEMEAPRQKGLAEVYEEEHLRKTDPDYVDKRTEKLKKEHAEIEAIWKDISHKLDSLASFRYRPKPAEMSIAVRSDAPAMSLEDARPSGVGGDIGTLDQLAPQEIFTPGETKEKGKIVTKGGTIIDQAELTREERKRRRRREKERAKKAGPQREDAGKQKSKSNERLQITGDLKKGGVKVIGRKGDIRDVEGNEVKETSRRSAGNFKL
jgi:U3 small nucleolar RNA-associated protein MPP10